MIYFAIGEWGQGFLLAAHTEKGLRAILLGQSKEEVLNDLYKKFPNAKPAPESHAIHRIMPELIRYTNSPVAIYKGDLDLQGTDFQKSVWKILQSIPLGKTMSYSEVAQKLGRPKSYRAVAQACGANALPLVIPCHRVVGKEGLGGFRYGLPLKTKLLAEEALQAKKQK